jgi:hypothetical protein
VENPRSKNKRKIERNTLKTPIPLTGKLVEEFNAFAERDGEIAAFVAFYSDLGPKFLTGLLTESPGIVLDIYETTWKGSDCERDAAIILRRDKLKADQITELWEHANTPKGYALVAELTASNGINAASSTIKGGLARLGKFLTTVAGSRGVADDATMTLAFNATTVAELIPVLKLTVQIPSSPSHGVVRQKLLQHSYSDLLNEGLKQTDANAEVCNVLVLAAIEKATTKQEAEALVHFTSEKSPTRAIVLAKASTLPRAEEEAA